MSETNSNSSPNSVVGPHQNPSLNLKVLSDRYLPQEIEPKIYQIWESQECFKAQDRSTKPPFSLVLPPPNVTGFLHLGHALNHTIQDVLVRWKRMQGYNVLWLPGTDHAGIATQSVIERELRKEGLSRQALGREKFLERVWAWKHQYGDRIYSQMRRLGDSCDWSRASFTLDKGISQAVRKVFADLYKKGWIYRGKRLVNWSGPLETAISDLEVEYRSVKGALWHIRYPLLQEGKERGDEASNSHPLPWLVVATTRPETLLGDTAVAVHPEDERYKSFIGKKVLLPLLDRPIPIIGDSSVDPSFGSGVVKITPAHDFNDYKVGKTHNLPLINILTPRCELNQEAGPYAGLKVPEARKKVLEDLLAKGFLEKEEPYVHNVGHCSRSGAVVEPYLSEQWFLKTDALCVPARRVVESGALRILPESWTKVYLHWMSILEDWCISRQLWWGHRIPAWHCQDCGEITVSSEELPPTHCGVDHCKSSRILQDEDVLDTWFSAALWPFSTLGWPQDQDGEVQKTFYPTSILITAHDILFFWVARMIMMGLEFKKDIPFREVYIHGLIRDAKGQKMSKSLGNSVDPVDMIEKYGADALRFSFMAHLHTGKDFKFSEARTEGYRNFMNKIWNAARFTLNALPESSLSFLQSSPKGALSPYDQWIIYKLEQLEVRVQESLEQYRFSDAAQALYDFIWHQFCDWYIEFIKPRISFEVGTQWTLAQVLQRVLKLLHPFCPFLTEELFQKTSSSPYSSPDTHAHGASIHPSPGFTHRSNANPDQNGVRILALETYPTPETDRDFLRWGSQEASAEIDFVQSIITSIRNIRGENRISPAKKIEARFICPQPSPQESSQGGGLPRLLQKYAEVISKMGGLLPHHQNQNPSEAQSPFQESPSQPQPLLEVDFEMGRLSQCALAVVQTGDGQVLQIVVPLTGLVDIQEEIKRIQKTIEKTEKGLASISQRLANPDFLAQATEEVVLADRKTLEEGRIQVNLLQRALQRLSE